MSPAARKESSLALQTALRVVLLIAIFLQIVFLAGRWRVRSDLTADRLYTLTGTSLEVIDKLEDRLLIECYFSVESRLPAYYRPMRRTLTNFLAEYEKLGKGKVVVRYFDPQDDNLVREKAQRLGMSPQTAADAAEASYSLQEVWQGVRLMYGTDKQRTISFLPPQAATFAYEAVLVPLIKDLTIAEKPRVALWASETEIDVSAAFDHLRHGTQRRTPPPRKGFTKLAEVVGSRYKIEPIKLEEGQLVPDHYEQLVLVRPKGLTDRQKYAIDQFLMRGGKLLVFMDTAEIHVGPLRAMAIQWVSYDAPDSERKLIDQLAHYGARVDDKIVADCLPESSVPFSIAVQTTRGPAYQGFLYPYWLHARNLDYAAHADAIGQMTPGADAAMIDHFRKSWHRGVNAGHDLFAGFQEGQAGPTMFWPCAVDLADPLPEGVTGDVLLRTSPLAFSEERAGHLHPVDQHADPRQWQAAYTAFYNRVQRQLQSEPRRQLGLMVSLRGPFRSFFADRAPQPAKGSEPPPEVAPDKDPLEEPIGTPPELAGPPGPEPSPSQAAQPATLLQAPPDAQLVVIADSDFIRDDLIAGEHQQAGGPYSPLGAPFFLNVMDWLLQDRDLLALRNRQPEMRALAFAQRALTREADEAEFSSTVRRRENWVQALNIAAPGAAMLALWLVVSLQRRARKRAFLASVGN